jgi:hypothetical protein
MPPPVSMLAGHTAVAAPAARAQLANGCCLTHSSQVLLLKCNEQCAAGSFHRHESHTILPAGSHRTAAQSMPCRTPFSNHTSQDASSCQSRSCLAACSQDRLMGCMPAT